MTTSTGRLPLLAEYVRRLEKGYTESCDYLFSPEDLVWAAVGPFLDQADAQTPVAVIEEIWQRLHRPTTAQRVAAYFRKKAPSADAARLLHNLTDRIAAAGAVLSAAHAIRAICPAAADQVLGWLACGEAGPASAAQPFPFDPTAEVVSPAQLLVRAFRELIKGERPDYRILVRCDLALRWLGPPEEDNPFRTAGVVVVPVAGYDSGSRQGFLVDLRLERLTLPAVLPAVLVEHPDLWSRPLSADLVAEVRRAWRGALPPVSARWSLSVRDPAHSRLPFEGRSLSAAAHAGFRFLARERLFPTDVLLAAEIGEGGRLLPVAMLRKKLDAAARPGANLTRAYIAPDLPADEAPTADDLNRWNDARLTVKTAVTLDAIPFAETELDADLAAYLDWVAEQHGRLAPVGPGPSVDLDKVYVALRAYETTPAEMTATLALALRQAERELEATRAADAGGAIDPDEWAARIVPRIPALVEADRQTARRPGASDRERPTRELNLGAAFADFRVLVILGDPGSGKTTLLRWLARHLALALRRPWHVVDGRPRLVVPRGQIDPHAPMDSSDHDLGPARIPVLLRASLLVEAFRTAGAAGLPLPSLREVLTRPAWDGRVPYDPVKGEHALLPKDRLARLLGQAVDDKNAVILIDGLDEIASPEDRRAVIDAVSRFLEHHVQTSGPPGRTGGNQVVLASRIVGYYAVPVPPELAPTLFVVRPMERVAVEHFCRSWWREVARQKREAFDPNRATGLINAIYDPAFAARAVLAGNPLLLTVMAAAYHREGMLPERRPELYRLTIDYLIEEWERRRTPGTTGLAFEETWTVLGALAREIHDRHETNLIAEDDAWRVVVGILNTKGKSREVAQRLADQFFVDARQTVGLFVEVSKRQWRFLHLNIQEYLAARLLVDDPTIAARLLVERLDIPRWRQTLMLALGVASDSGTWSHQQFCSLLDVLLQADDPAERTPTRLLPRGALLLADALPDMAAPEDDLFRRVATALFGAYADRTRMGRFPPLRARIEASFAALHSHWPAAPGQGLERFLLDQLQMTDSATAAAELIRVRGWLTPPLVRGLYEARCLDTAASGWVIDRTLQALAMDTAPGPEPASPPRRMDSDLPPQLHFRRWLEHTVRGGQLDVVGFLRAHPEWLRLLAALIGGFGDLGTPDSQREYLSLARLLNFGGALVVPRFAAEAFQDDDPLLKVARYLDEYFKERPKLDATVAAFRTEYVYLDPSEPDFTESLRSLVESAARYPGDARELLGQVVALVRACWLDGDRPPEQRAEALLGLIALGPDHVPEWEDVIARAGNEPAAIPALMRLRHALRDPVTRASRYLVRLLEPLVLTTPVDVFLDGFSAFLEVAIRAAAVPMLTAATEAINRCDPKAQGYLLAEAWAFWLSGVQDDFRYQAAVVLDTVGKQFQKDPMLLIRAAADLPFSRNLHWASHLGWPVEPLPARMVHPLDLTLHSLDVVAAVPDELEFVRYWALTDILTPHLAQSTPEALAEVNVLLSSVSWQVSFDAVADHLPAVPDWRAWASEEVLHLGDPYLKARGLARLALLSGAERSGLVAGAREAIRRMRGGGPRWAALLLRFGDWLLGRSRQPDRLRRALALERLLPLSGDRRDLALREAIDAVAFLDPDNRARSLTRLARFARGEQRDRLLAQSARAVGAIADEGERAETLSLLRREWQRYPAALQKAEQLAARLRRPEHRARALGWLAPPIRALGQRPEVREKIDPQAWAVVELSALVEDALGRLAPAESTPALWRRLADGDRDAEDQLRRLAAFDELPLGWAAAMAIDALLARGEVPTALRVFPWLRKPEPGVVPVIDGWTQNAHAEVKRHAALLLAEAGGLLRPDTVPGLVACLKDPEDRVRYRAARACYSKRSARHTRGLGAATMEALAEACLQYRTSQPGIALAIGWMWEQTAHNDLQAVRRWVVEAGRESIRQQPFLTLLARIGHVSDEVWKVIDEILPSSPPKVRQALLRSLRGMSERQQFNSNRLPAARQIAHRFVRDPEESVAIEAVRLLAGLSPSLDPDLGDLDRLAEAADDLALPSAVREEALAGLGVRFALAIDALFSRTNPLNPKEKVPPPLGAVEPIANKLQGLHEGLTRCFMENRAEGARRRLADGAARALGHLYLAWSAHDVPRELAGRFPFTPEAFRAAFGNDPEAGLWALLATERDATSYGFRCKRMVEGSVRFVVRHDGELVGPLVAMLARELVGPVMRGQDYWLMALLDVTAHTALRLPAQFAEEARKHANLADRLADAAQHHDAFPGRFGAVTLIGFLREPMRPDDARAIAAALRDVWHVQLGALLTAERLENVSNELREDLLGLLSDPSAIAAYAAAQMLVNFGTALGTPAAVRQRILTGLAEAASDPASDREVFRLDENSSEERWCTHHLGCLRDVFYRAMMAVSGLT